jgi:hypothetical protein
VKSGMVRHDLAPSDSSCGIGHCRLCRGSRTGAEKCEFSALATYKDGWQTWGPESIKYDNYINPCMRVAGYEPNWITAKKCPVSLFPGHNPYCYQPAGSIGAFFWRIELFFDGGSI